MLKPLSNGKSTNGAEYWRMVGWLRMPGDERRDRRIHRGAEIMRIRPPRGVFGSMHGAFRRYRY